MNDRTRCLCAVLSVMLLMVPAFPLASSAGDPTVLVFEPTAMLGPVPPLGWPITTSPWPPNVTNPGIKGLGASGRMEIKVVGDRTQLRFVVRGARSNTLYTIW